MGWFSSLKRTPIARASRRAWSIEYGSCSPDSAAGIGWQPGEWREVPIGLQLRPFLFAEILQSLDVRTERQQRTQANALTNLICAILSRSHATETSGEVGLDALLLSRFLADREQQESDQMNGGSVPSR